MKILIFDGYLGRDAEVRQTEKGSQLLSLKVANTTWIKGENKTVWYDVMSFDTKLVARAEYFKKGSHVYISGVPDENNNPSRDGNIYINRTVLADRIDFLSSGSGKKKEGENEGSASEDEPVIGVTKNAGAPSQTPPPAPQTSASADEDEDELPF